MPKNQITIFVAAASLACVLGGCSSLNQMAANYHELKADRMDFRADLRDIEHQQRQAARQFDRERAEVVALSDAACRDRQRAALQDQIHNQLQSKVAFDVNQGIRVGALQVDMDRLKKLVEQREAEFKRRQQQIDDLNRRSQLQRDRAMQDYLQRQQARQFENPNCGREAARQDVCGCERQCQCGECQECRSPCKKCGKKKRRCNPPRDPLIEQPPIRQPVREPILATEIPLMMPVTLEFGMDNPQIEEARIRRMPAYDLTQPPREPAREPCSCEAGCEARPVYGGPSAPTAYPTPPAPNSMRRPPARPPVPSEAPLKIRRLVPPTEIRSPALQNGSGESPQGGVRAASYPYEAPTYESAVSTYGAVPTYRAAPAYGAAPIYTH